MLKEEAKHILHKYCQRTPSIASLEEKLQQAVEMLIECFSSGGQLLICGNGGSCADADHIVGELVKTFRIPRPLQTPLINRLHQQGEEGAILAQRLQGGLPAINLGAHAALMTAMVNDVGGEYIYAQQVQAYGQEGDILLGITTSGNSKNVLYAGTVAKAKGMKTLGLTGKTGGKMAQEFDLTLCVQADSTEDIQDLHSVLYHAICAALEYQFWGE